MEQIYQKVERGEELTPAENQALTDAAIASLDHVRNMAPEVFREYFRACIDDGDHQRGLSDREWDEIMKESTAKSLPSEEDLGRKYTKEELNILAEYPQPKKEPDDELDFFTINGSRYPYPDPSEVNLMVLANNTMVAEPCAICGTIHTADSPLWFFNNADYGQSVCSGCAKRYEPKGQLAYAIEKINESFWENCERQD